MKVLFLVQKEQRIILDRFYDAIADNCDMDIRWLNSHEQAHLRQYFKSNVKTESYDRIMLFLRFKKEIRQVSFIKTIPNLVILEHDAYQNYIDCKYKGKFSKHYQQLLWARVLTSGATVTQKLQKEGFDAVFVPKGYDQELLHNLNVHRDIELGFVGSIKSATYSQRKAFLEQLAEQEDLLITRTKSGEEYLQTLNRIRFFVSADIGMGENMIKNFEAMACGCVLFAYDQGKEENRVLGFKDMHNIVLYQNISDFKEKLNILRSDKELCASIARNGQELAEQRYTFTQLGKA
ncbi:MAG: glycosyltransferase family 1 protein, partial [Gammaproteobacteria bacterium]|nr:glycosyltransferase family 1 protein [Gammaproteobacteria bacterium]